MTTDLTIELAERKLVELKKTVDAESMQRFSIETNNPDYLDHARTIEALDAQIEQINAQKQLHVQEQETILQSVPDSRPEFEEEKQAMLAIMRLEGLERFGSVVGKFRQTKTVNTKRLYEDVLQGDTEEFLRVATVSQKALSDFAAERPEIKKAILGCIEITARELQDISFEIQA